MRINFNPHLSPGYFETHEVGGLSWRAERPVREFLSEESVARVVATFGRETGPENDWRNSRESVSRIYEVGGIRLEVIHHCWERIPTVRMVSSPEPTPAGG